ncbi:hypothetical protein ACQP1G_15325 [Nocardia sp. CA-107356]
MNSTAIAVSALRTAYGDKTVLDGIDRTIGADVGIVDQPTGWVR